MVLDSMVSKMIIPSTIVSKMACYMISHNFIHPTPASDEASCLMQGGWWMIDLGDLISEVHVASLKG